MPDLAVSSWSFHKPLYAARMRLWDVPAAAAALGMRQVELQDTFLWPYGGRVWRLVRQVARRLSSTPLDRDYDPRVLARVETALERSGARLACWTVDTDFTLPWGLKQQLDYVRRACRVCRQFGGGIVRVTGGYAATDLAAFRRAADGLARAAEVAGEEGVRLALENHGGITVDADATGNLIEAAASPALGACLDFGNFLPGGRPAGLLRLAPLAIHVHAKAVEFTPSGEESHIDYRQCLAALARAGYVGAISIEYEGDAEPAAGIAQTRALIERLQNGGR